MGKVIYKGKILQDRDSGENVFVGKTLLVETYSKKISQGKVTGGEKYCRGKILYIGTILVITYICVVKSSEGQKTLQEVVWKGKYDEGVRFIFGKIL